MKLNLVTLPLTIMEVEFFFSRLASFHKRAVLHVHDFGKKGTSGYIEFGGVVILRRRSLELKPHDRQVSA